MTDSIDLDPSLLEIGSQEFGKLSFLLCPDVVTVQPLQFFPVVNRRAFRNILKGKFLYHSFQRKSFLAGRRRPAQKDKIVLKGFWQKAFFPVLGNRCCAVAFTQGRAVRSKDQRVVSKERRLPAQCLIKEDLPGRIGEMVFPPDDMRDVHQMVIDDTGKIVSGHSIRPDNDKIADSRGIEIHLSMDEIFEKNRPSPHVKPDDGPEPGRFHPGDLGCGEGTASSVIAGHLSLGELFLSEFFESLFGAKTLIALPFLEELIGEFTIDGYSLRLTIRTPRSPLVRAFFPGDPQPLEIFYDPICGSIGRSFDIRIFNAENECSLMPSCKEKIEEGRSGISDMEKSSRSRGKADPNFRIHLKSSSSVTKSEIRISGEASASDQSETNSKFKFQNPKPFLSRSFRFWSFVFVS